MRSKQSPKARRARRPRVLTTRSIPVNMSQSKRTVKPHATSVSAPSDRSQSARDRASDAIAAMQRDSRLRVTRAAKRYHTKVATIQKFFRSVLRKVNGRFEVRAISRYSRTVYLPDEHGNPVPLQTPSRRERKQASDYLRDVGRYLGGKRTALSRWRGKKIAGVDLVTDGRTLVGLEPAPSDFSLYRTLNGGAI
jgi:hypothetical protein